MTATWKDWLLCIVLTIPLFAAMVWALGETVDSIAMYQ